MATKTGFILMSENGHYLASNWMLTSSINNAVIVDKNRADFLRIKNTDLLILPAIEETKIRLTK